MSNPNDNPRQEKPIFHPGPPRGAMLHIQPEDRIVKIYPLLESEIDKLAVFNTFITLFISTGTGAWLFVLGLHVDLIIEAGSNVEARRLVAVLSYVLVGIGVLAYMAAAFFYIRKRSDWKRILQDIDKNKTEK